MTPEKQFKEMTDGRFEFVRADDLAKRWDGIEKEFYGK